MKVWNLSVLREEEEEEEEGFMAAGDFPGAADFNKILP